MSARYYVKDKQTMSLQSYAYSCSLSQSSVEITGGMTGKSANARAAYEWNAEDEKAKSVKMEIFSLDTHA